MMQALAGLGSLKSILAHHSHDSRPSNAKTIPTAKKPSDLSKTDRSSARPFRHDGRALSVSTLVLVTSLILGPELGLAGFA